MALETATYISDLNTSNPTSTDPVSQGDDHLRLIKSALSTTPTNWLLTNHPGVYLFGALAEGAPYLMEDERTPLWDTKYRAEVAALQQADDAALRSGSAMRVRTL